MKKQKRGPFVKSLLEAKEAFKSEFHVYYEECRTWHTLGKLIGGQPAKRAAQMVSFGLEICETSYQKAEFLLGFAENDTAECALNIARPDLHNYILKARQIRYFKNKPFVLRCMIMCNANPFGVNGMTYDWNWSPENHKELIYPFAVKDAIFTFLLVAARGGLCDRNLRYRIIRHIVRADFLLKKGLYEGATPEQIEESIYLDQVVGDVKKEPTEDETLRQNLSLGCYPNGVNISSFVMSLRDKGELESFATRYLDSIRVTEWVEYFERFLGQDYVKVLRILYRKVNWDVIVKKNVIYMSDQLCALRLQAGWKVYIPPIVSADPITGSWLSLLVRWQPEVHTEFSAPFKVEVKALLLSLRRVAPQIYEQNRLRIIWALGVCHFFSFYSYDIVRQHTKEMLLKECAELNFRKPKKSMSNAQILELLVQARVLSFK